MGFWGDFFFNMHYVHTIRLICITALSLILACFLNEREGGIDNGKQEYNVKGKK